MSRTVSNIARERGCRLELRTTELYTFNDAMLSANGASLIRWPVAVLVFIPHPNQKRGRERTTARCIGTPQHEQVDDDTRASCLHASFMSAYTYALAVETLTTFHPHPTVANAPLCRRRRRLDWTNNRAGRISCFVNVCEFQCTTSARCCEFYAVSCANSA